MMSSQRLIDAAQELSAAVNQLPFAPPITHIYNPLDYAWAPHEQYLRRYGEGKKRIVFLGMNPGPFGMVQIGVPFGEIGHARDWLGLDGEVRQPVAENPARRIEGWACQRSEVSGQRLWSLFRERFGTADRFFAEHFVANYCPLAFLAGGRNVTPDKLPSSESAPLYAQCDEHLLQLIDATGAEWVVGIGAFAEGRAKVALNGREIKIGRILHPSPASPAANRGWAPQAEAELVRLGLW